MSTQVALAKELLAIVLFIRDVYNGGNNLTKYVL